MSQVCRIVFGDTNMQTCDNWDTDCNSYNWKTEFIAIFVPWQLRVTLDSIRNSCDVWSKSLLNQCLGATQPTHTKDGNSAMFLTVNCNFSLTDLNIQRLVSFLESLHCLVLIFWCLKWVSWTKSCILGLCKNGGSSSSLKD